MTRECHVRFCERLGVKLPGATLPLMTKKEGFVQLADASWTTPWCLQSLVSVNFLHPGGSGRQVTHIPFLGRFICSGVGLLTDEGYWSP